MIFSKPMRRERGNKCRGAEVVSLAKVRAWGPSSQAPSLDERVLRMTPRVKHKYSRRTSYGIRYLWMLLVRLGLYVARRHILDNCYSRVASQILRTSTDMHDKLALLNHILHLPIPQPPIIHMELNLHLDRLSSLDRHLLEAL